MGRVTRLAVNEGDRVKAGQFLLQIDPVNAPKARCGATKPASAGARTGLEQSRVSLKSAQANLELARQNLKRQQELWAGGLTTRETLERAQAEVDVRESDLQRARAGNPTREEQLRQQEAGLTSSQHNLRAGAVRVAVRRHRHAPQRRRRRERRRRHDEQRRHGAADDCRHVGDRGRGRSRRNRHPARPDRDSRPRSRSTRLPDKTFTGRVTEIGNSPIQAAGAQAGGAAHGDQLQGGRHDRRARFPKCGRGSRARRRSRRRSARRRVAVPIQALTVRELLYDEKGNIVREPRPPKPRVPASGRTVDAAGVGVDVRPSSSRVRSAKKSKACSSSATARREFVAGQDRHRRRALLRGGGGLKEGDRVITGPFDSVRNLYDGDLVKVDTASAGRANARRRASAVAVPRP